MSRNRLIQKAGIGVLRKYGFQFPQEHGLTAIWSASLILSFGFILGSNFDSWGSMVSVIFAIILLLSSENISRVIKSKRINVPILPSVLVFVASVLLVMLFLTTPFELFLFGLVLITFLAWALVSGVYGAQSTISLSLGAFSLSAIFPLLVATGLTIETMRDMLRLLAIWWLFSGLTVVLVLHVQAIRRKTSRRVPLLIWGFFLISFIPLILTGLSSPWILLATIEPTFHGLRKALSRNGLPAKLTRKDYKIMGRNLTIRLLLFVGVILIVHYLAA